MFGLRQFILLPVSALALTTLLTGCVNPKATTMTEEPLQRYKRVYIATANPDPRQVHPKIVARLRSAGFEVREIGTNVADIGGQGTGFVVDKGGAILTCAHVFGTNTAATIWLQGKRFEADVVAQDTNVDLAVLRPRGNLGGEMALRPLALAPGGLKLGQTVYTMGFPLSELLGKSPRLNKGLVSATVGFEDDARQYQVSVEVQPGNSGGPLLSETGEVVGIVTSTLNPLRVLLKTGGNLPQNVNFASKADVVAQFARSNNVPIRLSGGETNSFETIQQSLVLVRAGIVAEGDENAPEMACSYSYVSFWDLWYRFRVFHMVFVDMKTGKPLLRVGQYRDNVFSTEDAVMDRAFAEIKAKFAPEAGKGK